jgi:hypothetical protein
MNHEIIFQKLRAAFLAGASLAAMAVPAGATSNYTVDTTNGFVGPTSTTTTINNNSTTGSSGLNIYIDRSGGPANNEVVTAIGVYSTAAATFTVKILKENSSTSFDVVVSESFSHPGGGFVDHTLTSPYTVPGSGTYRLGAYVGTATHNLTGNVARSVIASDAAVGTGYAATAATNPVFPYRYTTAPNNMTVVTTFQTADASVSNGRVLLEIDPIDAVTLNTDLTVELTCDGGANWAAGTLSSIGKGQGGRTIVETADTACTAGTSVAARIKTFNHKSVNIYKTTVSWH